MKLFTKSAVAMAAFGIASVAMAADPLANTKWQTIDDEDGKVKSVVLITESNGVLTGKVVQGFNAEAKKHVGKTVITGLKAKGGGKYAGGKITDPSKNKTYRMTAKLSGSKLVIKGHLGPFSRSQTWKKK